MVRSELGLQVKMTVFHDGVCMRDYQLALITVQLLIQAFVKRRS